MDEETLDRERESATLETVRTTLRVMLGGLDPSIANANEEHIRNIGVGFGLDDTDVEILVSHLQYTSVISLSVSVILCCAIEVSKSVQYT